MPLSKRVRFEIFKRDSFTCQYCGRQPPEIVLEVDHIEPRSGGGSNDAINLLSSCADCNRGKGKTRLDEKAIRPDADLAFLAVQQEIAEARRFLREQAELTLVLEGVMKVIQDHWAEVFETRWVPDNQQIRVWLNRYSPNEIVTAIDIALGPIRARSRDFDFDGRIRYVSGILKNRACQEVME